MSQPEAFSVFISYAHADNESPDSSKRWLDRLLQFLQPLVEQDQIIAWSDSEVDYGEDWHAKIHTALQSAKAAVLLVSPAFLASRYIRSNELPVLLQNAKDRGVVILPIILRPALFNETSFKYPDPRTGPFKLSLSSLQAANSPSQPLNKMTEFEQDQVLLSVAQRLLRINKQSIPLIDRTTDVNRDPPLSRSPQLAPKHYPFDSSGEVDKTALKNVLVRVFDVTELEELCLEIQESLARDGTELLVNLEVVGGQGKRGQALNLIQYLDRRGLLSHLIEAVRKNRPGAI